MRSASDPRSPAPTIAPTIAAAETSPLVASSSPKSLATSGLATPMMKKSKPSSMIPSAASSQNRTCSEVMRAASRASPSEGRVGAVVALTATILAGGHRSEQSDWPSGPPAGGRAIPPAGPASGYNCGMGEVLSLRDGTVLEVVTPGAEADGRLVEVLFTLPPGRRGPPAHVHPHVEDWEVVDGTLDARVGGERRTLGAGASLSIPPGTAHTFRNSGDDDQDGQAGGRELDRSLVPPELRLRPVAGVVPFRLGVIPD
jgi:quercetin dioxygenase-like cupin family protein